LILIIGILYYANNDRYEGEWEDDEASGKGKVLLKAIGTFYKVSGESLKGVFKNGELIQ